MIITVHPPQCEVCGASMQKIAMRTWRCPWRREPVIAECNPCQWPMKRRRELE